MRKALWWLVWATVLAGTAPAQTAEETRGWTLYERFQGSFSSLGSVTRLDSTVGYNFNQYFGVDAGLPVYFVKPSSTTAAATGTQARNGIGNAYLALRLTLANPVVNYASTLTGTAPTGDRDSGFSTGRATFDWNNHFDRSFDRLTPFANLGVANTISDTQFFLRPFSSFGFVTHADGGLSFRLSRFASVGGSLYVIAPAGRQTVVSRVVGPRQATPAAPVQARGRGRANRVFETANSTSGDAEIARDDGASAWLQIQPAQFFDFVVGYTRSVHYALDTVSFGVGLNVASILRKSR